MHLATDTEAPTGIWSATVKVGGAAFTKLLNIETIKPNRLKITFTPDKINSWLVRQLLMQG
jgi:uncharacterized protein YfaS (alpha-2-macroglobulin family)